MTDIEMTLDLLNRTFNTKGMTKDGNLKYNVAKLICVKQFLQKYTKINVH